MTIICWDGKTLAADRMAVMSGAISAFTKIFKVGADLFGVSGCLSIGVARIDWARAGMNRDAYPRASCDEEWGQMLRIDADGRILLYNLNGTPMHFESRHFAIGSGRDYALAAMHLGHTSAQAAQVACDLSNECGMGIDTLDLR